ncbi:MAG: HalOD1 output domain-containing protein [Haloferacaceae archaeon]
MTTTARQLDAARSEDVVVRITEAVAASSGDDPLALPPLGNAVDVEAIEALVDDGSLRDLTFTYHGHRVTVDGDGRVRVSRTDR